MRCECDLENSLCAPMQDVSFGLVRFRGWGFRRESHH